MAAKVIAVAVLAASTLTATARVADGQPPPPSEGGHTEIVLSRGALLSLGEHVDPSDSLTVEIVEEVRRVVRRVQELVPVDTVLISMDISPDVLPFLGVAGRTDHDGSRPVIFFKYDPQNPNFELRHVAEGMAHELHHASRIGMEDWSLSLLELMVMEGLADHFTGEVFGTEPPLWSSALSDEQLSHYMSLARDSSYEVHDAWSEEFNREVYVPWFFGRSEDGTPPWVGYSVGWRIVSDYLSAHRGARASALVHVPSVELVHSTPEMIPSE